jgi:hypothetical protein
MPNVTCFFDEFLGTALLLLVVCAISDKRNGPPPAGLNPLVLFITVLGIGACLGAQSAYAINPARDLGPRLMAYMVGYGTEVWNYRNQYWLWCPILAPICGALAGVGVYDLLIFEGEESIVNKPCVSLVFPDVGGIADGYSGTRRRGGGICMRRRRRSRSRLQAQIAFESAPFLALLLLGLQTMYPSPGSST